jgi:hypothetical protein
MPRPLKLPPIKDKAVEKAVEDFHRLEGELAEQHQLVTVCEQRHSASRASSAAEEAARVQAAVAGKPEPARSDGNTAATAAEARARLVVLTQALEQAREGIDEAIRSNLPALISAAETQRDLDRKAYVAALTAASELSTRLDESAARVRWFGIFAETPERANWPQPPRKATGVYGPGNQENCKSVHEALEALRLSEEGHAQGPQQRPHLHFRQEVAA